VELPLNILLIEDDEDDILIIRELLNGVEGCVYNLQAVATGKAGLRELRDESFDVCLVSYKFSGGSGIEFIAEANRLNLEVPLILIAGASDRGIDLEASDAGAANFFEKANLTSVSLERAIRYAIIRTARAKLRNFTAEVDRSNLERELRQAIAERQFEVYLQPEIHCETLQVDKAEALVRWNHPQLGLLGPGHFIDVAEKTGLIIGIGKCVLEKICEYSNHMRASQKNLRLAFNASIVEIERRDFVDVIEQVLVARDTDPSTVEIEITESVAMGEPELVRMHMDALKRIGVKFALDDFGTGHSGLETLKNFPFDVIKIDRSFVQTADKSARDRAIAKTIFYLADIMRLETVAEGIETDAQFAFIKNYGATYAQGFRFSHPLNFSDFRQFANRFDVRWEENELKTAV